MHYQDEIESGRKSVKSGWTLQQQVEHYRRKLIKKVRKTSIPVEHFGFYFNVLFFFAVGKGNIKKSRLRLNVGKVFGCVVVEKRNSCEPPQS
jgi:hypothetical protein